MDEGEARTLLQQISAELRGKTYAEIRDELLGRVHVREVRGPSGRSYQVEVECRPDSPRGGATLRIVLGIDDGGRAAFRPITDTFTASPDP